MEVLSRALLSLAAIVAALILVAAAVLFLGAALYLWLVALAVAPALAALIVGVVGFVLAGLIVLAARLSWRCRGTRRPTGDRGANASLGAGNLNDLAAQLGSLAARELSAEAQAHPYRAVVVSLLAGLAVGGSPTLRNVLDKLLKN